MTTYYIDYNAADDSADGLTTSTPWKRNPYMAGFSGSYAHSVGDRFIHKGGVTWPASVFSMSPANGSSGNIDYYGADVAWYVGGSFTRPIFDGEYTENTLIYFNASSYIEFDNIELKRVSANFAYTYGMFVGDNDCHHITISNCYLHGWRTTASTDDAHGGVIFTTFGSQVDTIVIDSCEVTNEENVGGTDGAGPNGVMFRMVGTISNCYLHHNSSCILYCLDCDGNIIEDINGPTASGWLGGDYHPNGVYLDAMTLGKSEGYIRNTVFIGAGGGANMAYLNGRNSTLHCYNKVFYGGATTQGMIEIDPYAYGDTTDSGIYNVYNNTCFIESGDSVRSLVRFVDRGGAPAADVANVRNNHIIYDGASCTTTSGGGYNTLNASNNVIQTLAAANSDGYNQANEFAPTSGSGATIDLGTPIGGIYAIDIVGVSRPQGAQWDIGAYEFVALSVPAAPANFRLA